MDNRISALSIQKNNPGRINVFINGSFSFAVSRLIGAWLQVGQNISEQKIAEMTSADEIERAFQSAIHFLSYRNRSEAEVRQNLEKKGFSELVIIETMDKLKAKGMVDDTNFAHDWVENRVAIKPRGRRLLEFELKQKKVDPEVIHQVLESLPDELTLAVQSIQKKMHHFEDAEKDTFIKKLTSYLLRKGFNYEIVKEAINRSLEEMLEKQESGKLLR
jgi:regulatory protein